MRYGEDAMKYISTYYFETKGRDENNYRAIVNIFAVSIMFPLATFTAFTYLAFFHSQWITEQTTIYIKGNYKPVESSEEKKIETISYSKEKTDKNATELSLLETGKHVSRDNSSQREDTNDSETTNRKDTQSDNESITQKEKEKKHEEEMQKKKDKKDYFIRRVNILALSASFILLCFTLAAFHVMASMKLIDYGNEVLFDENVASDIISNDYNIINDDQCVPIVYVTFSFIPSAILMFLAIITYFYIGLQFLSGNKAFGTDTGGTCLQLVCLCICCCCLICEEDNDKDDKDDDDVKILYPMNRDTTIKRQIGVGVDKATKFITDYDTDKTLGFLFQVSFGGFLVYLGFYFSPYMALAFINDPIQTGFIYLVGSSFAFCIFTNIKAIFTVAATSMGVISKDCSGIPTLVFVTATGISVAYFLIIFLFILTLGNFHDFQAIQNLTLPLIIGLLSLFVFKPFIKYARSEAKKDKLQLLTSYI